MATDQTDGLVYAGVLDGKGGARDLDWGGVNAWVAEDGPIWVHLHREEAETSRWLHEESGLDDVIVDALLATETRPRCVPHEGGMLVILRGVNLNPGADPEDMISIRIWVEKDRVISMRGQHILGASDVRQAIYNGAGPTGTGELLVLLADAMTDRLGSVVLELDDNADMLEDQLLEGSAGEIRRDLSDLRRRAIGLRRFMAPQREAFSRLLAERPDWLTEGDRLSLREIADRLIRYIEDLDAARDRAAVTQEELSARVAEDMNRNMYLLSIVAALFLPLGFVTGLLGINVGGIPGAEVKWAFAAVCALLAAIGGFQVWIFRRIKLI
jgi:zinc transporter